MLSHSKNKSEKEKMHSIWFELINIDVVDEESALLFQKKTADFIDVFLSFLKKESKNNKFLYPKITDFINEKDFFEKWMLSDGKALILLAESKVSLKKIKIRLFFLTNTEIFFCYGKK